MSVQICAFCGTEFETVEDSQQYCSSTCRAQAKKARRKATRPEVQVKPPDRSIRWPTPRPEPEPEKAPAREPAFDRPALRRKDWFLQPHRLPSSSRQRRTLEANWQFCRHCGQEFDAGPYNRGYCGLCGDPKKLASLHYRMRAASDPELHEKKLAANRKWREWAKVNDPEYRRWKAESQRIWRMKQKGAWMK